jgi:hypothetical protein
VILDKNISRQLHDRYMLSNNKSYIITSADVIARGQLSSIKETKSDIPFNHYREE